MFQKNVYSTEPPHVNIAVSIFHSQTISKSSIQREYLWRTSKNIANIIIGNVICTSIKQLALLYIKTALSGLTVK